MPQAPCRDNVHESPPVCGHGLFCEQGSQAQALPTTKPPLPRHLSLNPGHRREVAGSAKGQESKACFLLLKVRTSLPYSRFQSKERSNDLLLSLSQVSRKLLFFPLTFDATDGGFRRNPNTCLSSHCGSSQGQWMLKTRWRH